MQTLTSTLGRLVVVLTGALALGSCSRSNYAFLPKADSYLGTTTAAPKVRQAPVAAPVEIAQAPVAAPASIAEAPTVAPEIVVATPPTPRVAPATIAAEPAAVATAPAAEVAATMATPAPQKLSLVQRMALAKVTKKINKLASKSSQFKQGDNTAHTARISGNLRTGIVLILIGLLISLLSGISGIFGLIGGIIAIIGLIFIILWLLDEL